MKNFKPIIVVVAIMFLIAGGWYFTVGNPPHREHAGKDIYYCPMHPDYTSDRPGTCPICNMNLVKRKTAEKSADQSAETVHGYAPVELKPDQVRLLNIQTIAVEKKPVKKTIRAVGYVAHDIDLYQLQNEYIAAYQEYVSIYRDYRRIRDRRRNWESHRELQAKVLETEHKLTMLGLGPTQLEKLRNIKWWQTWDQPELLLFQRNQNYWIFLQLFESDLGFIDVGQPAIIEIPAFHETLQGVVRSVGGAIDQETRTVRAIVEIQGYRGELTAYMLAYAAMSVELGGYLTVPRDAVMDLGTRKVVFIEKAKGIFEPVEIEVGFEGDGYWAVNKGISQGDRVVASGNFLLDSESRLRSKITGGVGHVHN